MSIIIATKTMPTRTLQGFIANGGEIRFPLFNFGIKISGDGDYREIKLTAIPQNEKFTGKIQVKPRKKKQNLKIIEDKEEELWVKK